MVMGFTVRFLCAGLKVLSSGRKQLARFWNIAQRALAIIVLVMTLAFPPLASLLIGLILAGAPRTQKVRKL